jgi:predicted transcriptional regulator
MSNVITFRVEAEVVELLDGLAKRLGRSRSSVVAQAIREYAEEQAAFLQFIAEGDRDFEEGRIHSEAEVRRHLSDMKARAEAELVRRSEAA